MKPYRMDRWPAFVGLVLLGVALSIMLVGLGLPTDVPSCPFQKAILCAELPSSGAELAAILASPPNTPGAWTLAESLDLGLLVGYGTLLAIGAHRLAPRGSKRRRAGLVVLALGVTGAALDALENSGTLVALARLSDPATVSDGLAATVATAARVKFTLLGLACLGLAWLAWSGRRRHPVLVGLVALGGLVACGGAVVGWARMMAFELSAAGVTLTLLGLWSAGIGGRLATLASPPEPRPS